MANQNLEQSIFLHAIGLTSLANRAAYLDEACRDNPMLRAELDALLKAHDRLGDATPPSIRPEATSVFATLTEAAGAVIGPYKLLQQIGEGGMGVVFMAEQMQPVQRKVALKIIKPGMDSRQVIARFEAERQALAIMDHVNIARVIDGGTTESGRPYFVMELINGIPITKYCDDNHLTPRERLELFVPVCHALQHAHQKGIIHRDIKPSNVMITLYDGKPVPKVIDFGVAKATEQKLTERTLFTQYGTIVGTLEYMSPEQAEMSALGVDTRSDIYSLGVLLYELLTGSTPLTHKRMKDAAYAEILRMIKEEEPQKPSTRLSNSGDALASISAMRKTEPAKLSKLMRGELDWIVMKTLEKNRNRRYETVNGFAMDIQRYLADEPVLACPPSAGYRFRKFARRNKRTLATVALLGAMLLVVAGSFGWNARDRALQRGRNAEAVAALLDQCKAALEVDRADRAAIALEAAEQRAAAGGAEELADRLARCRADLGLLRALNDIDTFRWTWADNAFPERTVAAARWRAALTEYGVTSDESRAGEAAARVNGSPIRDRVLTALDECLAIDQSAGLRAVLRAADSHPYRDAVRDAVAAGNERAVTALVGQSEALTQPAHFVVAVGRLHWVPVDRKRAVLETALRARTNDLGMLMTLGGTYPLEESEGAGERVRWFQAALAVHPGNLAALNNLGLALRNKGDLDGAIATYREAIRLDPNFARVHSNLGVALRMKGDVDGAIRAYRDAIRADPKYAQAHHNLGVILYDLKRDYDGAIATSKEAVRLNPKYTTAHNRLGSALLAKGDPDGAIAAYKDAIASDPTFAPAYLNLGLALQKKGNVARAVEAFREAARLDPKYADAHFNLGNVLLEERNLDGAIEAYRRAVRANPQYADAHTNLGHALLEKQNADEAIMAYREAIRADPRHAIAHHSLGVILCDVKRDYNGAIAAFREATRLNPKYAEAHNNLGVALRSKGNPDGAIAAFREAIRTDPRLVPAYHNLGALLCDVKRDYDEAIATFREATRLNPKYADAHFWLGVALRGKVDAAGSVAAYREAIRLNPKNAAARNNLASLLASGPDQVRDGIQAVEQATQACELTAWKNASALSTLAVAHAEAGDFDKAVEFQQKVLTFPDFEKQHGKWIRERLQLYQQKKPYRDPDFVPREVDPPVPNNTR